MATNTSTQSGTEIGSLLQGIATDVARLIEQQFQLLRTDLNQELDKARNAAISLGSGAGLVAVGGILGTLAGVHFLHRTTRLPLWSCYGLVGGFMGAAGAGLLSAGKAEAAQIRLIPSQTAETLREDAESLKRVMSKAGA